MNSHAAATAAKPTLHPAARMGAVTLAVSNLAKSVDFYRNIIGLTRLNEGSSNEAVMGVGKTPLLILQAIRGAVRQPDYSTGLYHVAILVPSRPDLGRFLINLARTQYPVQGFGDHLVSEAIYLADPDGNGLEVYRDRPRDEWQWEGSKVKMATDPVDVEGIVAAVENPAAPFTGMHEGTTIGHMHLRIGDVPQAEAFYSGIIGFDVVATWHSALFVSAGGYHHHLGLNTWHSRNAPPAPANSVGLREYTIILPDSEALAQVVSRLESAGIVVAQQDNDVLVNDPWQNRIRLTTEQA